MAAEAMAASEGAEPAAYSPEANGDGHVDSARATKLAQRRARQRANKKALRAKEREWAEREAAMAAAAPRPSDGGESTGGDGVKLEEDMAISEGAAAAALAPSSLGDKAKAQAQAEVEVEVEVEPLAAPAAAGTAFESLRAVMEAFSQRGSSREEQAAAPEEGAEEGGEDEAGKEQSESVADAFASEQAEAGGADGKPLSNRERKRRNRLSLAELKQLVPRPDVVEAHDPNSPDPKLLVFLKAYPGTVPVPRHWQAKSKYLSRKRGIDKPIFQLPKFIEDTGITKMRGPDLNATAKDMLKNAARARMQPKLGKIDVEYGVLFDAFFKYQTKPRLTRHGDLYYEGKEFEVRVTNRTPGQLSPVLMQALGMRGPLSPPPWLRNMQRRGPPPSYPFLKVPGVNAPIPQGARYGLGPEEWGIPPVDQFGRPLYGGQVYDTSGGADEDAMPPSDAWGQLRAMEAEEEAAEEAGAEGGEEDDGLPPALRGAAAGEDEDKEGSAARAASGVASTVSSGLETPQHIQLRKDLGGAGTETPRTVLAAAVSGLDQPARPLFQVLEEKAAAVDRGTLMGTTRTYALPSEVRGAVEVTLAPEELDKLDAEAVRQKFQAKRDADKAVRDRERAELQEVIEEEESRRKRRKAGE